MAILVECSICHNKQAERNRICSCGEDLLKAKKSKRVRYWVRYQLPSGKRRKEYVGKSIEEARATDGKLKALKKENRILDISPESRTTWLELAEWYLNQESVKNLKSVERTERCIKRFVEIYGNKKVNDFKVEDLEKYQALRAKAGLKPSSIHQERIWVGAMVRKADDNEKIDPRIVKVFRRAKKVFKAGSNARDKVLSIEEYQRLLNTSPDHLKDILIMAYNTGMRPDEMYGLKWSHIDREKGFIRLPAEATKEGRAKNIPINTHAKKVLNAQPRHINHEYVFTYRGEPIKTRIRKSLSRACRDAKILYGRDVQEGFVFKDMRTSVKTNMAAAGVDEAYRNFILGHSMQGMDKYYMKPTEDDLHEAMGRYTKWLDDQLSGATEKGIENA